VIDDALIKMRNTYTVDQRPSPPKVMEHFRTPKRKLKKTPTKLDIVEEVPEESMNWFGISLLLAIQPNNIPQARKTQFLEIDESGMDITKMSDFLDPSIYKKKIDIVSYFFLL
jgi:hypothetical protein